jgi:hypothetical protein
MRRAAVFGLGGLMLLPACSGTSGEQTAESAGDYMPLMSRMEAGETLRDCMTDLGWDVELSEFGEIESEHTDAEVERYAADLEACFVENGFDKQPPPMDPDVAGGFFDLLVESAACLDDLGYAISAPPARQAYIDELVTGHSAIWDPYADIVELVTPEEWDEVRRSCPQPERPDLSGS